MKLGIDLGGSHIAVGIITEEGKMIAKQEENISFTSKQNQDLKTIIRDKILSLIPCVLQNFQIPIFPIQKIGIGVPGIVIENNIKTCTKYGISNWNLKQELEDYYKIPVMVQNDAICATKAEKKYGNLQGVSKAVFLCLGTGIGGATIIGGNIIPSEYGHMVIEKSGRQCHCGKRGCFETYSSMQVLKNTLIEHMKLKQTTTSEELLAILKKESNTEEIHPLIEEYLDTLLIGISNIVSIINPEVICLGGSFTYFAESLYKTFLEKVREDKSNLGDTKFVLAKLQNTAGIIGATLE